LKDYNKLAQMIKILSNDYGLDVWLNLTDEVEIYIKEKYISDPGWLFQPGFSVDEVEGLVDFMYEIVDQLDSEKSLDELGGYKKMVLLKWGVN
jgi:hypothetical protein